MTMFSSIGEPGEASEGKPKVVLKGSFRAGRHVVSNPKENMASREMVMICWWWHIVASDSVTLYSFSCN